jgi:hypothetical protein
LRRAGTGIESEACAPRTRRNRELDPSWTVDCAAMSRLFGGPYHARRRAPGGARSDKEEWHDGTTHLLFEPQELLEKLAALIPRPRFA